MVMIRLARIGKKNHPTYRVVVSDKQKDMRAPYLEALGSYDPHTKPSTFNVKKDRLEHWISVGAQLSDTVYNLCVTHKLIDGEKRQVLHKQKPKEESAEKPAVTPEAPKAEEADKKEETPKEPPKEEKPEEKPKEAAPAPEAPAEPEKEKAESAS